jgi:hypothetical protein
MLDTATTTTPVTAPVTAPVTTAPVTTAATRPAGDLRARAAGLAAFAFVGVVLAQNAIRGGSAPANGADADEVLAHYADERTVTAVLAATFVVGGAALATFLGGTMRRLVAGGRPGWAYTGLVGAAGVLAVFAVLVGTEGALHVVTGADAPSPAAVEALWALHGAVFSVLLLFIGVALLGLARAGVAAGVTPRAFDRLAPVGSALLAVGAAAGPAIAAGDATPLFGVAIAGFVVWLAFLATTGARLLRADA